MTIVISTGFKREEVVGQNCASLYSPGSNPGIMEGLWAALRDGNAHTLELGLCRRGVEPMWAEVSVNPIRWVREGVA